MDNQFYNKKITPYLDGSLSADEVSEFEAFVSTHPEYQKKIEKKQEELTLLKELMPASQLSKEGLRALNTELRQSVFHLLKQDPKNPLDRMKQKWEEWISNR